MKKIFLGLNIITMLISCSVQQFAVNTQIKPFENGGKVWGERTKKCGEKGWESECFKDKDIHLVGINVKKSNTAKMAEKLGFSPYTIETKSNLILRFLTFGIVDYKIVKIIKRAS